MQPKAKSEIFLSAIITTASQHNHLLLWSMYPAGVRGRVFGGSGEDPAEGMARGNGGW
jgi:hypothetical protein